MAIAPKIKHVDQRPNGVLRFRRRFPKDVAEHLGKPALQVHIRNTSGVEFYKEYQAIPTDFERIVVQTRAELNADDSRDAPEAVTVAVSGVGRKEGVFARYARPRGADAASAALMKHLRLETQDSRHSVHGLRHRVSDKLREAGAPTEVRHGFLGHANEAVADSTYGGREARLREFQKWVLNAEL